MAEAWEAELIAGGNLLPNRQGKKPDTEDLFAGLLADFQKRMPGSEISVAENSPEHDAKADGDAKLIRETIQKLQKKLIQIESEKPAKKRKSV